MRDLAPQSSSQLKTPPQNLQLGQCPPKGQVASADLEHLGVQQRHMCRMDVQEKLATDHQGGLKSGIRLYVQIQGAQLLPSELWSVVLSHLEQRDRMVACLVCKMLSKFGAAETVKTRTISPTEIEAISLMQFLSHSDNFAGCKVGLYVVGPAAASGQDWTRPCLYNVLACSHLTSLMVNLDLGVRDASTILELAPANLRTLKLLRDLEVVPNPAWGRLRSLASFKFVFNKNSGQMPCEHVGLLKLPVLTTLTLLPHSSAVSRDILIANGLQICTLEELHISRDPFAQPLDLAGLPALRMLSIEEPGSVPSWVLAWPLSTLSCNIFRALKHLEPAQLLCTRLVLNKTRGVPLKMSFLLAMPRLQALQFGPGKESPDQFGGSVVMRRTSAMYNRIMQRIAITVTAGFRLDVQLDECPRLEGARHTVVPVGSDGHPVLCRCTSCLRSG